MSQMHSQADALWAQCLESLEPSLSLEDRDTWIRPLQPALIDGALVLYSPNGFVIDAIRSTFLRQIKEALPEGTVVKLEVGDRPKRAAAKMPSPADGSAALAKAQANAPSEGAGAALDASKGSAVAPGRKDRSPKPAQTVEPGWLPAIWSDAHRALPSEFFRCALFTINRYGESVERPKRDKMLIFSQKNFAMYVTGEETNMQDQEVLMQLLHYQRKFKLGRRFTFSARQVLEDMGKAGTGREIATLIASIERLHQAMVRLEKTEGGDTQVYGFNLIAEFARDGTGSQSWTVAFNEVVGQLMGPQSHTRVLKSQRDKLSGKNLALWLHGNMSSHANPFPATTEFLYKITGSNVGSLKRFRQKVREALEELVEVGFLLDWSYDSDADKFSVRRAPTPLEQQ